MAVWSGVAAWCGGVAAWCGGVERCGGVMVWCGAPQAVSLSFTCVPQKTAEAVSPGYLIKS